MKCEFAGLPRYVKRINPIHPLSPRPQTKHPSNAFPFIQEPTVFSITTHPVSTVLSDPDLITSLASYSESQRPDPIALEDHFPLISSFQSSRSHPSDARDLSALFLHIQAAADYYTMNRTLMETVPPVFVDIILDPYLLNVLPRSLVPTVVYILLLAVAAWFIAGYVIQWLQDLNKDEDERVNDKKTS